MKGNNVLSNSIENILPNARENGTDGPDNIPETTGT